MARNVSFQRSSANNSFGNSSLNRLSERTVELLKKPKHKERDFVAFRLF